MKKIIYLAFSCLVLTQTTSAQDLTSHYLYQMNWYNVNPALTGNEDFTQAIVNPGTQWVGMEGNPTNSMIGLHSPFKKNMGIGGKMVLDQRHQLSNLTAELTYAYKAEFKGNQMLSFGITAGIYQQSLNVNSVFGDKYTESNDPALSPDYYNATNIISGFGVSYNFKNLEVGASIPHLVVSGSPLSDHIFAMAKYNFEITDYQMVISPIMVYQNISVSPSIMDFGLKALWNKIAWGQFTMKTNNTSVMAAGVQVKDFHIGYAYSKPRNELSAMTSGSHELIFVMNINKKKEQKAEPFFSSPSEKSKTDEGNKTLSKGNESRIKKEIDAMLLELGELTKKQEDGTITILEKKRINEIKKRVSELKEILK